MKERDPVGVQAALGSRSYQLGKPSQKMPEEVLQPGVTEGGDVFQSGYSLISANSVFVPILLTPV